MKKILTGLLGIFLVFSVMNTTAFADTKEMRGAWISTVWNLDWPTVGARNNVAQQKQEYIALLDKLQAAGLNSVIVQVRPKGDALYNSSLNPWSDILTGTQGKNPGYDPLAFMIEETHKRGMEFHAWFNPYRITTSGTDVNTLASNNMARKNPSWAIAYNNALYYDPGNPQVVNYLVETVAEVVKNYKVDGIHFDDYFYPSKSFNDDTSYSKYGNGINKDDWRRANVNTLIQKVHAKINSINSSVSFGVSPRGIWKNASSDPAGSATNGGQSYYDIYCDSVAWIKNGWVDYINPQIYWTFENSAAPYGVLVDWWAKQVQGTNVKLYIGHDVSKTEVSNQIEKQVNYSRANSEVDGNIYFRAKFISENSTLQSKLKQLNKVTHKQLKGLNRYETSVKVSKEGWSSANTVLLVNGYANADGLVATPLASAYGAPIILSEKNSLPSETKAEIKRLNPSKVILIGGKTVLSDSLKKQLQEIKPNLDIDRIGGATRFDTSLLVAKKLDTIVDVNKSYVCYGLGEADALSIAAKAGEDKAPIILAEKNAIPKSTIDWLRGESLQTAYFIGGTTNITKAVISQMNSITSSDVSGNRVAGNNRYDTNAAVIKKFYTNSGQSGISVTKGLVLADALTSGPLAAKLKTPIVLVDTELSNNQKQVLSTKQASLVYEIGGGINPSAVQDVINRVR
ncbi:family 10 glycosylhydrolase [Clostridium sp. UBA5119]|uniref:family 10 glycosylhydrolase n=1 Tax=Clostridium sp. UBA5119 TaxID=1946366 RepID=UPI003216EC75